MKIASGRGPWPYLAWCVVVFGLFNSCYHHHDMLITGRWLDTGKFPLTLETGVRALRAAGADDGDINRYYSYVNAMLGRPYQGYFVRALEGWKIDARLLDTGKDGEDPEETPPVTPTGPLVPYRDFSVEYPPGFFLVALPPWLFAHDMNAYRDAFSVFMGLLLALAIGLAIRAVKRVSPDALPVSSVVAWSAGAALALGVVTVRRYDPVVALALCITVWGCAARRPIWTGLGFGLGVAAKGVPVLIAPLLIAYFVRAKRSREAVIAAVTSVALGIVVALPFALSAGRRLLDMLAYHGGRPLQIESTGGALVILGRLLDPSSATLANTFGSANVIGRWDAPLRAAAGVLPFFAVIGVAGWAWWAFGRAIDDRARLRVLIVATCATFVAFMTLGKVFSPQYLVWLLPLGMAASLLDGDRRIAAALVVALFLTHIIYPFLYRLAVAPSLTPAFGAIVLVRNLIVLGWAAALLLVETSALQATSSKPASELP